MRHFYTLRCPAPFWLIQCKPYRDRLITAKVIDKSLGARFLWLTVCIYSVDYVETHLYNDPHCSRLLAAAW